MDGGMQFPPQEMGLTECREQRDKRLSEYREQREEREAHRIPLQAIGGVRGYPGQYRGGMSMYKPAHEEELRQTHIYHPQRHHPHQQGLHPQIHDLQRPHPHPQIHDLQRDEIYHPRAMNPRSMTPRGITPDQ